jgi:hypothetical protein
MRKISEYRAHAEECRQLARQIKQPEQQRQLEEMAKAWDMLADERQRQIAKPKPSLKPL